MGYTSPKQTAFRNTLSANTRILSNNEVQSKYLNKTREYIIFAWMKLKVNVITTKSVLLQNSLKAFMPQIPIGVHMYY